MAHPAPNMSRAEHGACRLVGVEMRTDIPGGIDPWRWCGVTRREMGGGEETPCDGGVPGYFMGTATFWGHSQVC